MRLSVCIAVFLSVGCCLSSPLWAEGNAKGTVRLAFVGDIRLDGLTGRAIAQGRDPFRPFSAFLRKADIRVGNLECVVAKGGVAERDKMHVFRAHPRVLPVLARHIDVVGLANNHSGDYGPRAFSEMLGHLERQGIRYFGGGRNLSEAHQPLLIERNGLRIALLGYDDFFPRSFEAQTDLPGVAWAEESHIRFDIAAARRLGADLVIPVMHWGWEYETEGNRYQRALAYRMIEAGADAVMGGHPHVLQDVEVYQGKPIVYGIGNFLFDGFNTVQENTSWAVMLTVNAQGVQSAAMTVARLDHEGIPHPRKDPAPCWEKGDSLWKTCHQGTLFKGKLPSGHAD